MTFHHDHPGLVSTIRTLYRQNPAEAVTTITKYLQQELSSNSKQEQQQILANIQSAFTADNTQHLQAKQVANDQFLHFCSLLLGKQIEKERIHEEQLQQQLNRALTAIFETLNHLIRTINLTLYNNSSSQETIRYLIGEQLDGSGDTSSLETHLLQIHTAFATSHKAFRRTMQKTVEKILEELSPEKLSAKRTSHASFNPLKKMDDFKQYRKTYADCREWYDSGRCVEEFLRTFERECTAITNTQKEVVP